VGLRDALIGQVAPWTLLVSLFVWIVTLVMTGRLISRTVHLDRVSDLKAAIAALEATVKERERQISELMGRQQRPS
jgi:hypothetical protein